MSADGKIALPSRKQIKLSNQKDAERVNQLRKNCDAILVGIGTVIEDNPKFFQPVKSHGAGQWGFPVEEGGKVEQNHLFRSEVGDQLSENE